MLVGTALPEHYRKAQAEGMLYPYANHNPDYRADSSTLFCSLKIGTASVAALLAA